MNLLPFALVAYLVMQFGIAFFASRFIKVEADYFLAGRKLGVFAVALVTARGARPVAVE
jgi:hypothetical protein